MVRLEKSIELLFEYLRDVLYDIGRARLDVAELHESFKKLGEGMQFIAKCLLEVQELSLALSRGDLNPKLPSRENTLAAPMKALHASLKHMTWQSQQVSKGDYKQRVDFMGEFADAFNTMTEQLEQRQRALEDAANLDSLTGVYTRYYGMNQLNALLHENRAFCLCFIDIDNLKYVNDTYGHSEGDKYIINVANSLVTFFSGAVITRLGGDEFMLLVPNVRSNEAAERFRRLLGHMQAENPESEISGVHRNSLSYGIVEVEAGCSSNAGTLLSLADERMYQYKRKNKAKRNANASVGKTHKQNQRAV